MTLDPDSLRSLAGIRFAIRRFLAASETITKQGGVTPLQHQALLAIETWDAGRMAMKDLAEQLLIAHHAAVQLVNRLEKAGLAERTRSSEDRRNVWVSLTRDGRRLLDRLASLHLAEMLRQEPLLTQSLARLRKMHPAADTQLAGYRAEAVDGVREDGATEWAGALIGDATRNDG
jgi:DNA-binding MarR family transcriptional regulator